MMRLNITTRQYGRLVRGWVISTGLEPSGYGTHSMRRAKVAEIYRKTGNLRAVQLLLGHTKIDSTLRYLGVELEDALSIAESYCQIWCLRVLGHAAIWSVVVASIPSLNLTPVMTLAR
jgi:integrase